MSILDTFFPRYCITCGKRLIGTERSLCLHCLMELPRTSLWTQPEDNALAKTYWSRTGGIEITRAAAYLQYSQDGMVARIVRHFKYYGNDRLARDMGYCMAREMEPSGFFADVDCIVPVPLTLGRWMSRGYNQSTMLAKGISKATGLPVESGILKRKSFKGSQTDKGAYERAENVSNVFKLRKGRAERMRGKHLLLVDDVITTGATTRECCMALNEIPEAKVSVLGFSTVQSAGIRKIINPV